MPATAMNGVLSHYWAQGMEEGEWLVFHDQAHARRAPDGRESWAMEGMWRLAAGASLTIFAPDGHVLWSGTLAWRRTGWLGLLGPRTLTPPGIDPSRWLAWFHHDPPLAARYAPGHAPR